MPDVQQGALGRRSCCQGPRDRRGRLLAGGGEWLPYEAWGGLL